MKKLITLLLATILCLSLGAFAFADLGDPAQPNALLIWTKKISTASGIEITVRLSLNDSNGDIAGVQSVAITYVPTGISQAQIVDYTYTSDYVAFCVKSYSNGIYQYETALVYSGFSY